MVGMLDNMLAYSEFPDPYSWSDPSMYDYGTNGSAPAATLARLMRPATRPPAPAAPSYAFPGSYPGQASISSEGPFNPPTDFPPAQSYESGSSPASPSYAFPGSSPGLASLSSEGPFSSEGASSPAPGSAPSPLMNPGNADAAAYWSSPYTAGPADAMLDIPPGTPGILSSIPTTGSAPAWDGSAPGSTAPGAAPSHLPEGSLMDRLKGAWDQFSGGFQNLAPALGAMGASLMAPPNRSGEVMASMFPKAMDEARQNQTIQALIKQGVPPAIAMGAAQNPLVMMQFLSKQGQFTQIGEDALGNKSFGFVDPFTRKVFDLTGNEIGGNGSTGVPGIPVDAGGTPLEGPALLSYLERSQPTAAAGVKAILAGNINASGRNLQKLLPLAARIDPNFTQQVYQQRQKAYNYWYGGGKGDNILKSLDQATEHADSLVGSVNELGNWQSPQFNAATNALNEQVRGLPGAGPLRTNAHALADELGGLWKGANLSDAEIKAWGDAFPVNGSIPQQKASVAKLVQLMEGGMTALEDQRQRDFGARAADLPGLISDKTRATLAKLKTWANSNNTPAAPGALGEIPDGWSIVPRS